MKTDVDLNALTAVYGISLDNLIQWVKVRVDTSEQYVREHLSIRNSEPCVDWWTHPEILGRFAALHMEWQKALNDGTLSSWWLNHWDPQISKIKTLMASCNLKSCGYSTPAPFPIPELPELAPVAATPPPAAPYDPWEEQQASTPPVPLTPPTWGQ